MPRIKKINTICVLAFFIFSSVLVCFVSCAQAIDTLENGLRIIVREDHRNPIVVFSVFIDTGSAKEEEYLGSGISHLIEHMLFKGTKKYPKGNMEDILHRYGGVIDGFTSHDYTGIRITILKEHMDVGLDILKEMLSYPLFDAAELEKEKKVIEREMDLNKDDPARRISNLTFSEAYFRHPYRVPVIGYRENFRRLKSQDLIHFFDENYTPENIVIACVGDIDKEECIRKIKNTFSAMPRGKNIIHALSQEGVQLAERIIEEKKENIKGSYLNIAFHSSSLLDNDLFALDLLSFILGQGESSVLNKVIRLDKKLALSIASYNFTPQYPGLFIISCALKEENIKEAFREIVNEIEIIKEKGVAENDLAKAKNNFLAEYIYQKETIESQANELAIGELLTGNPYFFEAYITSIKPVTANRIQEVANKYLTKDNMTVVALTESGNALEENRADVRKSNPEILVEKVQLKNGLDVLISENHALPMVSMAVVLKGGLRYENKENNGISKLTSLMLMDGLEGMTKKDIAEFFESRGMGINTYSANNSTGITVTCLKKHTEDALRLVSELISKPNMPDEELDREKKELLAAIEMQDNQIFNHGHRLLKELLFDIHPYGFQAVGTNESINKIKRDDVLRFHNEIFSSDNMVLGISGDCEKEEIKTLVEKYFLNVPSNTKLLPEPEKERPLVNIKETYIETHNNQSIIIIGFHGLDIFNSKDRYAVEAMVDMLSSETGILFKNIREKIGLSYSQGGFQVMGIDPGYIALYTLTSKENINKVRETILKEIGLFMKNGPRDEELEMTKNHLKAMQKIGMQANKDFIFTISLDELYGLGYENYKNYSANIDALTRDDIKRAAEKYLTLDRCAIVIIEGENS